MSDESYSRSDIPGPALKRIDHLVRSSLEATRQAEEAEALLLGAIDLLREFRCDFQAFITAFEAVDPWSGDGEDLAKRMDAFLAQFVVRTES